MIGLRVGPFEITDTAMVPEPGDWYWGERSGSSRRQPTRVLIRMLPPDAPESQRAELQRQFDNLRGLEHDRIPSAVALYDGVGGMAIQSVRGVALTEVIRGRATDEILMTPATLLDVLIEIADVLQFAHHRNRSHGHLDPNHIVLGRDGSVWVFGFAAGSDAPVEPGWAPPERAREETATPATDQWSLAALGTSLITGRSPWQAPDPLGDARIGDPDALIAPVEKQWPALARLFRKMMDNRPGNRHPTMHQVRQELLALSRKAGGTSDRRDLALALAREHLGPTTSAQETLLPPVVDGDAPTAPVEPPPERPTIPLEPDEQPSSVAEAPDDPLPPEDPSTDGPPSDVDEPEIQIAHTMETPAVRAPETALPPDEPLPVVRPETGTDVPLAGTREPMVPEDTGPTVLADIATLAAEAGLDLPEEFGQPSDTGELEPLNIPPHDDGGPKSVSDPPSVPMANPASESTQQADQEATVLYASSPVDDSGEFDLAGAGDEVVDPPAPGESDSPLGQPAPTLTPTTDSGVASAAPNSHPPPVAAARPAVVAEDDGFLPQQVPDSVVEDPSLGIGEAQVSMRSEPGFAPVEEDGPLAPVTLPPRDRTPQRIAQGAIVLMVVVFVVWMLSTLL